MSRWTETNTYESVDDGLRAYILQVFTKMGIALAMTAAVAFMGYRSLISGGVMYRLLVNHYQLMMIGSVIIQLGICIGLSSRLTSMSNGTATSLFYIYAGITGISFSVLPLAFQQETIFGAFLFAAVLFVCCLIIGHTTTVDLTRFSGLMIGGLLALVITSVLSWFVPVLRSMALFNYLGVVLFLALTAWDMQRIKQMYYHSGAYGSELTDNIAVFGAFQLYLDFINLFLYILRILGSRRRR